MAVASRYVGFATDCGDGAFPSSSSKAARTASSTCLRNFLDRVANNSFSDGFCWESLAMRATMQWVLPVPLRPRTCAGRTPSRHGRGSLARRVDSHEDAIASTRSSSSSISNAESAPWPARSPPGPRPVPWSSISEKDSISRAVTLGPSSRAHRSDSSRASSVYFFLDESTHHHHLELSKVPWSR